MTKRIIILSGPEQGREFSLEGVESLIIGRGESSDTQIRDPRISRIHCQIHNQGDKVLLADAGSAAGTIINGQQIVRHQLESGTEFCIGDTVLRYETDNILQQKTVVGQPSPIANPANANPATAETATDNQQNAGSLGYPPGFAPVPERPIAEHPAPANQSPVSDSEPTSTNTSTCAPSKSPTMDSPPDRGSVATPQPSTSQAPVEQPQPQKRTRSIRAKHVGPIEELSGQKFAYFRVGDLIRSGKKSALFLAMSEKDGRVVAFKVLRPELTVSEEARERFVRAAQTMYSISHPHIVRLYAAGKKGPICWCAMEYVAGKSLTEIIDQIGVQGMLDWKRSFHIGVHLARALVCAHENKIIHRNITPQSIMERSDDKVIKLCDLLLAKGLEGAKARQVTAPGRIVGNVPYMPPERTRDDAVIDGRSDLYGLGATLYALLTGRAPFQSNDLLELIRQIREDKPMPPKESQLGIDDRFQTIVMKMLEKNPEDRYQTPMELLSDLERLGRFRGIDADTVV